MISLRLMNLGRSAHKDASASTPSTNVLAIQLGCWGGRGLDWEERGDRGPPSISIKVLRLWSLAQRVASPTRETVAQERKGESITCGVNGTKRSSGLLGVGTRGKS
jgi:hypothetical protein